MNLLAATTAKKRVLLPRKWLQTLGAYGLLLPVIVVFATFFYVPAILLFIIAFFHWNLISQNMRFVGLQNFLVLWNQPLFWRAIVNTLYFSLTMVPFTVLLSLGLAMLFTGAARSKFRAALRSFIFLPHVTPIVATSIVWVWIFNPHFGLANYVLHLLGIPSLGWLSSVHWALPAVMINSLWHSLGLYVIIFLGGLTNIPNDVIEAAQVDGADRWAIFQKIIWPLLSPTTYFVIVLATINNMQAFSQIWAMTGGAHGGAGGPAYSTTTDALLLYQTAFVYFHFSLAAAMSLILFLIIFSLTVLQKWVADRLVFYQ